MIILSYFVVKSKKHTKGGALFFHPVSRPALSQAEQQLQARFMLCLQGVGLCKAQFVQAALHLQDVAQLANACAVAAEAGLYVFFGTLYALTRDIALRLCGLPLLVGLPDVKRQTAFQCFQSGLFLVVLHLQFLRTVMAAVAFKERPADADADGMVIFTVAHTAGLQMMIQSGGTVEENLRRTGMTVRIYSGFRGICACLRFDHGGMRAEHLREQRFDIVVVSAVEMAVVQRFELHDGVYGITHAFRQRRLCIAVFLLVL